MRDVAIYRHQLFKRSEPFIVQQASRIPGIRAVMVGRERLGDAPVGICSVAMSDHARYRGRFAHAVHALGRGPDPFVRILRPYDISLVHAHFGVEGVYAEKVASKLNVPLVTTFHGFDATLSRSALFKSRSPAWINYALHRQRLAARGELFVCVSNFVRERVVALGFPSNRCAVHHIGIDTDLISVAADADKAIHPTVIHVARLVEKKGTSILLQAFKSLRRQIADVKLKIVGEGPLEATLRAQGEALGISESVEFLGALDHEDVLKTLRNSWLLALPSVTASSGDSEGLGQVLLEAAAMGLPVVASRNGGIPDAVLDGVTGLLHDERDSDGLAESMAHLLEHGAIRRSMGNAARAHVEKNFNLSRQSALLSEMYRAIS